MSDAAGDSHDREPAKEPEEEPVGDFGDEEQADEGGDSDVERR